MKIQLSTRNRAYQFEAQSQERILYAALHNGIDFPYECGSGTCGTCKARLIEGKIDDLWPESPGRKHLKPDLGEFLMCQCVARTDISIEAASFVYAMDTGVCVPSTRTGVIQRSKLLARDVMALEIGLDEPCDFDAGQFMVMAMPSVSGYRAYSIVNFERQARKLDFLIKKKPGGGVSEWLFSGKPEGAAVDLYGPLGRATFYPSIGKNILCIAGGSGIAGMMSIISRACQEHYFDQHQAHIYFGVRTMKDAFFLSELSQFKREFPDTLHVTVALSDEEVSPSVRDSYPALQFDRGLIHEVAINQMKGKCHNVRAYLAGPPPVVDAAIRMLLLQEKLTTDNIRYDKFS